MTAAVETPVVETTPRPRNDPIDPEADADDALKTLRQFVLDDAADDAPPLDQWHGLDSYIEELCSFGVDRLTREPDDLNAACHRLKNDLEDVACGNYRALIESFECAGAVRDGVAGVRARLDDLVLALPKLSEATRQFSVDVADKQRERERRLRSLSELRAVADILEMPRLMRTLVAAELYDEALELRENIIKLAALHSEDRLIINVCQEMNVLTQQMVLQLLVLLRNAVQLPICLRVVGFLRRLGVFSEFRLRMLFLHCRGEWMRAGIDSATSSSKQAHLVNLSDNTRAMVFEVVTQYRAVFSDAPGDDEDSDLDDIDALAFMNSTSIVPNSHAAAILSDWTSSCIAEYLDRLEAGIKELTDGAALNSVMQQAMYCGQSLGRVGSDFRAALPPMFEDAVMRIYSSHLTAALRQFEMMIEENRWAPVGSSALRKDRIYASENKERNGEATESQPVENGKKNGEPDGEKSGQYDPPAGVLDSPPLAIFLNGILVALNELRLCAPLSLAPRLGAALQEVLINAGEYMSAMGGPGGAFLKRSDRQHFLSMSASLRDLCVPHAARCLDHCMGRNGLVDVGKVETDLTEIFGEILAPAALGAHAAAALEATEDEVEDGENEVEIDGKDEANGQDDEPAIWNKGKAEENVIL